MIAIHRFPLALVSFVLTLITLAYFRGSIFQQAYPAYRTMMSASYPQIVVTGDSISQQAFKIGGYGAALVDAYQGKADVVNRGMGGYNSKQLLRKLKEDFQHPAGDIKLFIIHIGTNDATTHGIQHIPVEAFTQNLQAIVTFLKETQPSARVILITPSTVDTASWLAAGRAMGLPDKFGNNRTPEQSKVIRNAVLTVGKENKIAVVDAWKLHDDAVNNGEIKTEELFSDGLHYSTRGYDYVNKALLATIKSELPALSPDTLPEGFTTFLQYDNEGNPEAQMMMKMFTERMEAMKQAALGNTQK